MFIIYGTCNHISWYLSSLTKDKDYIVYKKGLDLKSLPISHCVIASDPTKYLTLRNEFLKIYEISGCDGTLNIVHSYFDNFDLFNSLHKSFSHESLILNAYDFKTISFDLFGTLINDKVHLSQSQISYLVSKVLPIADRENYLILRKSCNSSSHYEHPSKTNLSNYYEFIGNKMHFSKKFFKYLESLEINFWFTTVLFLQLTHDNQVLILGLPSNLKK